MASIRYGFALACAVGPFALGLSSAQPPASPKPVVRSQDDLPRHVYPVPGTAAALLDADDAAFNAFAAKVAADADAVLAGYDIADRATRRRLLTTRSSYEMLAGRNEEAQATIRAIRALEDKPDARLTSGLREEAILRARIATGRNEGPAFDQSFTRFYREALAALPFAVVGTRLKETKGRIETRPASVVRGFVLGPMEAEVARDHAVGDRAADDLLFARTYERILGPTTPASLAALRQIIAVNTIAKPDIWAAREVTLTPADPASPVPVAVWDSGVDASLFPGQIFTPVAGPPGNGHGLSFDIDSRPTTGLLRPLTAEQRAAYAGMIADAEGASDSQAGIDSPAAERLRARLSAMPPAAARTYRERLDQFGDYGHGTHIAGIIVRGNPFVRLAVIRDTYDARAVPAPPSADSVARRVALYDSVSAWLKANRIRVVNMSWGETPADYEAALEKNGLGGDTVARKAMARRLFDTARDGFRRLLADNPDTLFVSTAGNADVDTAFEQGYPSSLSAPNLLIVSAVDQAGDETSFTSTGGNVRVSANGYLVESYFPGGARLKRSGTSMAAPNVVNLAAKLIALDPALTPAQTIALIERGATAGSAGRARTIDPKASVALLRSTQSLAGSR